MFSQGREYRVMAIWKALELEFPPQITQLSVELGDEISEYETEDEGDGTIWRLPNSFSYL
jgi:hypothetical protein